MAFSTPPMFATQGAIATQSALATRQALINMALGLVTPTVVLPTATPDLSGLESVNMTATAIAGAFLTATAQAGTPIATVSAQIVPTALPQTGLFDDVTGGSGGVGVLALAVVGLVGVIIVSRRLRSSGARAEHEREFPNDEQ
jgi:hypothetical protein